MSNVSVKNANKNATTSSVPPYISYESINVKCFCKFCFVSALSSYDDNYFWFLKTKFAWWWDGRFCKLMICIPCKKYNFECWVRAIITILVDTNKTQAHHWWLTVDCRVYSHILYVSLNLYPPWLNRWNDFELFKLTILKHTAHVKNNFKFKSHFVTRFSGWFMGFYRILCNSWFIFKRNNKNNYLLKWNWTVRNVISRLFLLSFNIFNSIKRFGIEIYLLYTTTQWNGNGCVSVASL